MKRLTRIILIQWYLFEKQDISMLGHTAIVGANGAGKSSIIDAVQTVLAGGDKNRISLNKGSNEKSSRTIREYCLGIVSDPNSMVRVEPRSSANTYIVLCFRDDEAGEYLCAGTSIWASANDPKESFNGYFIVRDNAPLTSDFFTENVPGGQYSLPWNDVRDRLLRKYRLGRDLQDGTLVLPSKGPGDFTRNFYTAMSAEPGVPMNHQTIIKALLSAIAFKPIADPTKFVQKNMLDPGDINIRDLKLSLDFWRGLRDKAQQTHECIQQLAGLEKICDDARQAGAEILLHKYASLAARVEQCYETLSPAQVELDELNEEVEGLDNELQTKKKESEVIYREQVGLEEVRRLQGVTVKLNTCRNNKTALEDEVKKTQGQLQALRLKMNSLRDVVKSEGYVSTKLLSAVKNLLPMVKIDDDLLSGIWPTEPAAVDSAVDGILSAYDEQTRSEMESHADSILQDKIVPLVSRNKDRARTIAQLENKETPLEERTLNLIRLLKKNRIEPTPLCDLIDVKDEAWRNTIEAILGNVREALVVPPDKAREAVRLYRYDGGNYRGTHIVNTTKTEEWLHRCDKGSLAELIETDNEHARAFINLRLGNIICVETETDLLKYKRAATADLMLTTGGTTTMMNEPFLTILGRSNREKQLVKLQKIQAAQVAEQERLQGRHKDLQQAVKVLESFTEDCQKTDGFTNTIQVLAEKKFTISKLEGEIAILEASDDKALNRKIEALKETHGVLADRIKELDDLLRKKEGTRGRLSNVVETQSAMAEAFREGQAGMQSSYPELDTAAAVELLERLRNKHEGHADHYRVVIEVIDGKISTRSSDLQKFQTRIAAGLQEFLATNKAQAHLAGAEAWSFDSFEDRTRFITERKKQLEETTLASYSVQAKNALRDVETIFRDKFIGRLGEKLKEVEDDIKTLNSILKHRPFHGEYYQFRAQPTAELKPVYSLAIDFDAGRASLGNVGGLFDPANDPESPHRAAFEYIKEAFQDEERGKLVQDYRNYFVFDVEMFDVVAGHKVANLKHRIAKGSGGENMAPFYVAIGSSLASAYKIQGHHGRLSYGGMNLAPFDEAFSKLDAGNIYNCLEFLKEIHLQVLLAAPDDKYTTLASQMNTIIWITRDGGNIEIETEYISDRTRQMLQSDSPFVKSGTTVSNQSLAQEATA